MTEVIILAAGIGSRLRPFTLAMPKCCVRIGDVSLISRLIRQLLSFNPDLSITVVGGYFFEAIKTETSEFSGSVKLIENRDYYKTNNMFSCLLAFRAQNNLCDTFIVNADCIYDDKIVELMVGKNGNNIAVDKQYFSDESMKVLHRDGKLHSMSKQLEKSSDVFTSLDFYRFTSDYVVDLKLIMEDLVRNNRLDLWTEVAIDILMRTAPLDFVDMSWSRWVEIDDEKDLKKAVELFGNG